MHLSPQSPTALADAYFGAIYTVHTWRDESIPLAFGDLGSPALLPAAFGPRWGLITAANPRSFRLSPEANHQRDEELLKALTRLGIADRSLPTTASDRRGDWPESGRLVRGIDRRSLLALARLFDQHACLYADHGTAGILWTDTERWVVRPLAPLAAREQTFASTRTAEPHPAFG